MNKSLHDAALAQTLASGWDDWAELQARQRTPILPVRDPPAGTRPSGQHWFGDLNTNRIASNC